MKNDFKMLLNEVKMMSYMTFYGTNPNLWDHTYHLKEVLAHLDVIYDGRNKEIGI